MQYQANPVIVDAYRITHVGPSEFPGHLFVEMADDRKALHATPEQLARMTPAPGDYVVVQSDGYTYLNPKDVFERKYSPIHES